MHRDKLEKLIDTSPMNRGLRGADWTSDSRNIAINIDDDVFMFDYEAPGVYQFHWLASEGGKRTIERTVEAACRVYNQHGAHKIYGLVPAARRDVRLMARLCHGKLSGCVMTEHGLCQIFVTTRDTFPGVEPCHF